MDKLELIHTRKDYSTAKMNDQYQQGYPLKLKCWRPTYYTVLRMLLNVMWQPGWEGSLRENEYIYVWLNPFVVHLKLIISQHLLIGYTPRQNKKLFQNLKCWGVGAEKVQKDWYTVKPFVYFIWDTRNFKHTHMYMVKKQKHAGKRHPPISRWRAKEWKGRASALQLMTHSSKKLTSK